MSTQATLSPAELRRWDSLSTKMSYFHNHFKSQFNTLYELADGSYKSRGLTMSSFLRLGQDLVHHLTMHHRIEEAYIFPVLGERMQAFRENDGEHLESHRGIHDGLDALETLLTKFKSEPTSYSPQEMKDCLDSFREVLFKHLDQEVNDLKGENMRKYWSLEELERIPM